MYFSGKITNSILTYLEKQGHSVEQLLVASDLPDEFLQDPTCWLDSHKVESFLKLASQDFAKQNWQENPPVEQGSLMQQVGHACRELRAWGVLDSVLKMMSRPQDILSQPERFLSYFVSPAPPIGNVQRQGDRLEFEIPITAEQYPLVTEYLSAAFEALPTLVDQPLAQASWEGAKVVLSWPQEQSNFFNLTEIGHNLKPELARTLVNSIESLQIELERTKQELASRHQQNQELQRQVAERSLAQGERGLQGLNELAQGLAHELNTPIAYITSNLMRLSDYLGRAQQLITILVGQNRLTPQVQEAMRRVDWEYVRDEFPNVVRDSREGLGRIQQIVRDLASFAESGPAADQGKVPADLNKIIDQAVSMVQAAAPKSVNIEKMYFLDQSVPVFPSRMEQALVNLIQNAVQAVDGDGAVRVVTRPRGNRVEVEVTDTGVGMDDDTKQKIFTPFYTTKVPGQGTGLGLSIVRSIVKMHSGEIRVSSQKGHGSTFLIDLPMQASTH